MKKLVSLLLIVVMIFSVMTMSISSAFAQEYNFEDNKIVFSIRDKRCEEVTLEKFAQYGVIEIEETSPGWYIFTLDKHDHQNVLDVIDKLEHAEDHNLYSVHVKYIPVEDPFENSAIKARFVEEYGDPQVYEEHFYHYSDKENNAIDWVLILAMVEVMVEPIENPTPSRCIIGDIVYSTTLIIEPFWVPYCVYDVAKDKFVGIGSGMLDEYEGLREVFCTPKYGKLIGDVNKDGIVSVFDATEIQRVVAEMSDFSDVLIGDYNRDKSIDVMDATAIQRKIAKLELENIDM